MFTILAVDNAKFILSILEADLNASGYKTVTANNGKSALAIVDSQDIDLILLDIDMPDMNGLEVLQQLKSQAHSMHIPTIMLSASDNEESIVAALNLGAQDYLSKPYITEVFQARIKNALRLIEQNQLLAKLAATDPLTGLNNRKQFSEQAAHIILKNKRDNSHMIIAVLDIDNFKQLNDKYGHEVADNVLIQFTELMQESFREYDILGRLGGEKFAVCMPDTNMQQGIVSCERFRATLEGQKIAVDDKLNSTEITVSIGVTACFAKGEQEYTQLLNEADNALHYAKENGRNQVMQQGNPLH